MNHKVINHTVENLTAGYGIQPAFRCESAPLAGVLAGLYDTLSAKVTEEGMDRLLAEVELPLALVLADMERTGMLVDKGGLVAFGER